MKCISFSKDKSAPKPRLQPTSLPLLSGAAAEAPRYKGFCESKGGVLMCMDADSSHPPEAIIGLARVFK